MYISNSCILPKKWTVETLMRPHKSEPFNPSIAYAFYRTGYIESWGRGILKICEACREFGTAAPEYTVLGGVLEKEIVKELRTDLRLNQKELANRLQTSLPSIQRVVNKLKESVCVVFSQ